MSASSIMALGEQAFTTEGEEMTGMELKDQLESYTEYLRDHGRSPKTILTYRQKVRGFIEWTGDRQVSTRLLFAYRDYLQSDKLKPWTDGEMGCRPRTVRSAFGALRSFWKFLHETGVEGLPDIACVPPPALDTAQREVPSVEQVRALYAAAERAGAHTRDPLLASFLRLRALAVLSLAFGCALRRSEMLSLDVQDIRLDTAPPRVTVRSGKGRKSRWVALGEQEAEYLRQWLRVRSGRLARFERIQDAVLIDDKCRRMGHHGVQNLILMLKKLAGLEESSFTLHGLRHRAGSIIVKEMGYKAAQAVLGHSSITTTLEVYTHTDADDIANAAASVSSAIHTPQAQPSKASAPPRAQPQRDPRRRSAAVSRREQRL